MAELGPNSGHSPRENHLLHSTFSLWMQYLLIQGLMYICKYMYLLVSGWELPCLVSEAVKPHG